MEEGVKVARSEEGKRSGERRKGDECKNMCLGRQSGPACLIRNYATSRLSGASGNTKIMRR